MYCTVQQDTYTHTHMHPRMHTRTHADVEFATNACHMISMSALVVHQCIHASIYMRTCSACLHVTVTAQGCKRQLHSYNWCLTAYPAELPELAKSCSQMCQSSLSEGSKTRVQHMCVSACSVLSCLLAILQYVLSVCLVISK